MDQAPGFEGFQLLRPVKGESRYFVVTHWASEEDFEAWRSSRNNGHDDGGQARKAVATGAELLEFEVVDLG